MSLTRIGNRWVIDVTVNGVRIRRRIENEAVARSTYNEITKMLGEDAKEDALEKVRAALDNR